MRFLIFSGLDQAILAACDTRVSLGRDPLFKAYIF
jgi:hypothetical protein